MDKEFVYLDTVKVYDEKIFTIRRTGEWKKHIVKSYKLVLDRLKNIIDKTSPVKFFMSYDLLDEVIIDAVIGMRKITDSEFNSVEDPNSFKIAAYLAYWFLRHKPISLHYPDTFSLNNIKIINHGELNEEDYEYKLQKVIWNLKHINELVAVQMVLSYIFDFSRLLCDSETCEYIKNTEKEKFCFNSFNEMLIVLTRKLTYYFSYRTIAPKVIEHILEGYTLHPAWGLAGAQWSNAKKDGIV